MQYRKTMDMSVLMDFCADLDRTGGSVSAQNKVCDCTEPNAVQCDKTCSMYCGNCGTVLYQLTAMNQPSMYGISSKGILPRYGNVTDKNLPCSTLGTNINGCSRLRRAHLWTNNNQEKSLKDKRKRITQVCKNNGVPLKVISLACDLYLRIHQNKHRDGIRRGRPLIGRMAACVGCAAKHHNYAMSEERLIRMFFLSDRENRMIAQRGNDLKHMNGIVSPYRSYVRKGMTYLLDLLFYGSSNHASTDKAGGAKTAGMKRIEMVCSLIDQHGTALGFDPVRCRIARSIATAIHKTKRDKDKQNKTFVSTCLVMTNDRYPLTDLKKKHITQHCGSTPGAINSFQKSILNYLLKKFQFDPRNTSRKFSTTDAIFNSLYPVSKDVDLWKDEEVAGCVRSK